MNLVGAVSPSRKFGGVIKCLQWVESGHWFVDNAGGKTAQGETVEFTVKHMDRLSAEDFETAPLWAGYYEPEDIAEIVKWGWREDDVRAALAEVGWEDDHYFPLPAQAADSSWGRGPLFAARVTTPSGTELKGYCFRQPGFVNVFYGGKHYPLGDGVPDNHAQGLASATGESIFPLRVINRVTGDRWELHSA